MIAAVLRRSARGLLALVGGALVAAAQEAPGYDPLGAALTRAAEALEGGAPERALEAARRALELAPGDARARLELLRALNAAGRHAEVRERVRALPPERVEHWAWSELGRAERALGRSTRAIEAFERALEGYALDGPARAALVEVAFDAGDLDRAEKELAALLAQAPDLAWALAFEGRLLLARGEREAALAHLREALPADDEQGSVRHALIEAALGSDPAEARALAEPWFDAPPSQAAFLLAGRAALAAGDPLAAIEVGLAALRREPGSAAALSLATAALDDAGGLAERLLERRLTLAPDDSAARAALARRALDAGDFERALAVVDGDRSGRVGEAAAGDSRGVGDVAAPERPASGGPWSGGSATGEPVTGDAATGDASTVASAEGGAVDGSAGSGDRAARRPPAAGEGGGAADALGSEQDAPDPTLELLAVEALRRSGRADAARARLAPLLDGGRVPPRAHYEDGLLRFAAGELEPAAAAFGRAALDGELGALAHFNRGVVLARAGRYAASAEAYERAVEADPGLAAAWRQLGDHRRFRLGERDRAAEAYRRYLELVGEDAEIRAWLAEGSR